MAHGKPTISRSEWSLLNSANVVLLPKKEDAAYPVDFRPISLMHSIAKILTKLLANRLAPLLPNMVSPCQSAFVEGRSIQDNYQYIQGAINHFNRTKTPMLFLKLNIAKAFDSVIWDYMLEDMQRMGFGQRWRDLICIIWANTSSRILLNGIPGRPIKHHRGIHQGDPLSSMLFILAMDPLRCLLDQATRHGLLNPIGANPIRMRTSLYVDDVAMFVRLTIQDVNNVQHILAAFGSATGLKTNLQKSELFMI
jgi:mannosylglycoprotein endo-beta-mannosidase